MRYVWNGMGDVAKGLECLWLRALGAVGNGCGDGMWERGRV